MYVEFTANFQISAIHNLWNLKIQKIQQLMGFWRPMHVIIPNLIEINQTVAEISQFNGFHGSRRRPTPSWVRWTRIGTTYEK